MKHLLAFISAVLAPAAAMALTAPCLKNVPFTQSQAFFARSYTARHIPFTPHDQEREIADLSHGLAQSAPPPRGLAPHVYTAIINKALTYEARHHKTHIFGYHAHGGTIQFFHDLHGLLYEKTQQKKAPKGFVFFRNPNEKIGKLSDYPMAGKNWDHEPTIRNVLLSASLTCAEDARYESALHLFANNNSMIEHNNKQLPGIFKNLLRHGLSFKTIEKAQTIYKENAPASLIQIIMPRNKQFVDDNIFFAKPYGYKLPTERPPLEEIDHLCQHNEQMQDGSYCQLRLCLNSDYFARPGRGIGMIRYRDAERAALFEPLRQEVLKEVSQEIKVA